MTFSVSIPPTPGLPSPPAGSGPHRRPLPRPAPTRCHRVTTSAPVFLQDPNATGIDSLGSALLRARAQPAAWHTTGDTRRASDRANAHTRLLGQRRAARGLPGRQGTLPHAVGRAGVRRLHSGAAAPLAGDPLLPTKPAGQRCFYPWEQIGR